MTRINFSQKHFFDDDGGSCYISKTSASVSSGVPNTVKQMFRFKVSGTPDEHEAQVFDMTSQMKQYRFIQCHIFGMFL